MSEIQYGKVSKETIISGKAFCGYCSCLESRTWAAKVCGHVPHQVWYTERNGDPITLVMPADVEPERFPSQAKIYFVFEWILPEDSFDSPRKVIPLKYLRSKAKKA